MACATSWVAAPSIRRRRCCRHSAAGRRCSLSRRRSSTRAGPARPSSMPNPFYQIYEGAALLAGAQPWCVNAIPRAASHPTGRRSRRRLGAHATRLRLLAGQPDRTRHAAREVAALFELSDRTVSRSPPTSAIRRSISTKPTPRCPRWRPRRRAVATTIGVWSCSAACRNARMPRDCARAMSPATPRSSTVPAVPDLPRLRDVAGGRRGQHRGLERRSPRRRQPARVRTESSAALQPRLARVLPCAMPEAAFYLWAHTPGDDATFARDLYAAGERHRAPRSFLAREAHGTNPGRNRIRIALVAAADECAEGIERIVAFATRR